MLPWLCVVRPAVPGCLNLESCELPRVGARLHDETLRDRAEMPLGLVQHKHLALRASEDFADSQHPPPSAGTYAIERDALEQTKRTGADSGR
jgi:hypothetical protein